MATKKLLKIFIVPAILSVFSIANLASAINLNLESIQMDSKNDNTDTNGVINLNSDVVLDVAEDIAKDARGEISNFFKNGFNDLSSGLGDLDFRSDFADTISLDTENTETKSFLERINFKTDLVEEELEIKFNDIENDPNVYFINILAQKDIISSEADKFYPNNHVRLYEVSKILLNSYMIKVSKDSMVYDYRDKINSAGPESFYQTVYNIGLLDDVWGNDNFEKIVTYADVNKIFKNFDKQYPNIINIPNFKTQDGNITRSEFSRIMVIAFDLDENKKEYSIDKLYGNKYADYIEILIQKEIIPLDDNIDLDTNIARIGFADILAKSIFTHNSDNWKDYSQELELYFVDVDYNQENIELLEYLRVRGVLDYLIEMKRNDFYLYPERVISEHEIYHILDSISDVQFDYDKIQADQEGMSIGEISKLLSELFNLELEEERKGGRFA